MTGPPGADLREVLERFDRMPRTGRAGRLLAGRRPPVSTQDLDAVRAAVDPWPVPADLETLLRWSDGWADDSFPMAFPCGWFDPARYLADGYRHLRDQPAFRHAWNPLWFPVFHESWLMGSIELLPEGRPVIVRTDWGDDTLRVTAPSLAAELDAVADTLESGLLEHELDLDATALESFDRQRDAIIATANERHGWSTWPHAREFSFGGDRSDHPAHWRSAVASWPSPAD